MPTIHKSLADKFNKKKTINNELLRISNIHKKINTRITSLKDSSRINIEKDTIIDKDTFYTICKIDDSRDINLKFLSENNHEKIPKIHIKEISIPINSIIDRGDITNIYQHKYIEQNDTSRQDIIIIKESPINTSVFDISKHYNNITKSIQMDIYTNTTTTTTNYDDVTNIYILNDNYENNNNFSSLIINTDETPYDEFHITTTDSFNDNFISNNIYKSSDTINMDISEVSKKSNLDNSILDDGNEYYYINKIKQNVQKIYHVYQENYVNNIKPTGFGDFIRSCFFIIQFCLKNGFEYEIIINHPISLFLNNFCHLYKPNNTTALFLSKNVDYFKQSNWQTTFFANFEKTPYNEHFLLSKQIYNNYIEHLHSLPIINKSLFSYNILFPIYDIHSFETNIVKNILEPTSEMINYTNETLNFFHLIDSKFIIIQIRSGDKYLKSENESAFKSYYIHKIKYHINIILSTTDLPVVLIADNHEIKYLLRDIYPNFKMSFKNITHIGQGVQLEREQIKNTLLDFYLMKQSSHIYSFTCYQHGSGFSYWCSKIYNIPYKCLFIENEN